jgi:hypothetical protein
MSAPLPTPDSKITTGKQFAQNAADLLDRDVQQIVAIVVGDIQQRYAYKANTHANLEALRDEVLTRLMEIGILATFDPTPCFYGEPPEVEILGRMDINKYGLDHEQKGYEVNTANMRGEDYLGQKGKSA